MRWEAPLLTILHTITEPNSLDVLTSGPAVWNALPYNIDITPVILTGLSNGVDNKILELSTKRRTSVF